MCMTCKTIIETTVLTIVLGMMMSGNRHCPTKAASASTSRFWSSVIQSKSLIWFLLPTWWSLPLLKLIP